MLNKIKTNIDSVIEYFEKHPNRDDLKVYKVLDKEYILSYTEALECMKFLINRENINFTVLEKLTKSIRRGTQSSFVHSSMNILEEDIEKYKLETVYDINKIKKNPFIELLNFRNREVFGEYRTYQGFCMNQNNYDNMISILKMLRRLKHCDYTINIDLEFDTNRDSTRFCKKILLKNLETYQIARFIM